MSRLKKLAEDFEMTSDGQYIDPETGEVLDYKPTDKSQQTWDQKIRNNMRQEAKDVQKDFLDPKYYNQWGKVSPFNIIMVDSLNSLYSMDPISASNAIINIIESLNKCYQQDKAYDYISREYINKLKMNLDKKKTIDKVVEYVSNIYFKGMNMSDTPIKRRASLGDKEENILSFNIDINDKVAISRALFALEIYAKIKR